MRVFVSESTDAILNLATEEWLFRDADIGQQTLYLWRNDKVRACVRVAAFGEAHAASRADDRA